MNPEIARRFIANQQEGTGVSNDKLGMWIFLASEVIFFAALIAALVSLSLSQVQVSLPSVEESVAAAEAWNEVQNHYTALSIPLATTNTFILILSSVFVVSAIDAIQKGRTGRMKFWLWLTLIGGAIFLYIQTREWAELAHVLSEEGFAGPADSVFAAAFYTATGFHGLHVLIGVLLLIYVLIRSYRGDFTARRYNALEMFGLYWHFVDLVWIILFTILYLV